MFTGQTTIGKVFARCPARTEPLVARMRLGHLFQSVDIAPRGFPPHAVLVIRRASAPRGVSLGSLRLRPEWERAMREEVSQLWRRAVRPARGLVPEWDEAILFADEGEWLACLGLAVARREVERHWCWRASLGAGQAVSSTQTLVRSWAQAPRFLPAALARLARWGEAARVLGALEPAEAVTLLSALRDEFDLPRLVNVVNARAARTTIRGDARTEPALQERVATPWQASGDERDAFASSDAEDACEEAHAERLGARGESSSGMEEAMEEASAPPWKRWLPSAGSECERLPAPAQHLLAFAAALFHAPAVARSRRFAEEVFAFSEGDTPRARPSSDAAHAAARREARRRSRLADERRGIEGERDASDSFTARSARVADAGAAGSELDAPTPPHPTREQQSARGVGESAPPKPSAHGPTNESPVEETASDFPVVVEDAREAGAHVAAWADLEGCETRLGGALFLLNLFTGLRLPECFDEDYQLSEHITGWGLAELLARALLGEACAEFERDPLWVALARLDGRAEGEPPAPALRVGESYRAPARWLKLFAPRDEEWVVCEDEWRLMLLHSGCFPVAVQPLNGLTPLEAAARLADEYRAQGVSVARLEPAPAPDARAALRRAGLSPPFERFSFFDQLFADGGGASLSADLRRWMGWTFSFLKYALGRSLAGEDGADTEEAMREMLVRRGRLYCTATHVDLVMEMSGVSLAARRAGFDASPGWVRDLVRVVAFHYE